MDDEKLIELVCKYEFLYNLSHPKYMDSSRKEIAWKEISDQLKQSTAGCKQRWQSLRDAYRRVLNKRKRKSGKAAKNPKQWKYESEMSFLTPYFVERKSHEPNEVLSDDEDTENDEAIESNPHFESGSKTADHFHPDFLNGNASVNILDSNSGLLKVEVEIDNIKTENNDVEENKTNKNTRGVKRKMVDSSAAFVSKLLYDQSKMEDELDRFFLNISDIVKRFSPYDQALARNKIFTLVSEMELQQLASGSSSRYAYSPSSQSASFNILPNKSPENNCTDQSQQFYE